jgi:hypothetical protein
LRAGGRRRDSQQLLALWTTKFDQIRWNGRAWWQYGVGHEMQYPGLGHSITELDFCHETHERREKDERRIEEHGSSQWVDN